MNFRFGACAGVGKIECVQRMVISLYGEKSTYPLIFVLCHDTSRSVNAFSRSLMYSRAGSKGIKISNLCPARLRFSVAAILRTSELDRVASLDFMTALWPNCIRINLNPTSLSVENL